MSKRNEPTPDSRQTGFDFEFSQDHPLGALAEFIEAKTVTVSIPVPSVLDGEPLPPPAKVLSVFDLFFSAQAEREELKLKALERKRKFEPKDFPDFGGSNFNWTDQEMISLHAQLLDLHLDVFSSNRTSRRSKINAIPWIFGQPDVQRENISSVVVNQALAQGFDDNIPFTFACACRLTGHDPDEVRSLLKLHLLEAGESELLALI